MKIQQIFIEGGYVYLLTDSNEVIKMDKEKFSKENVTLKIDIESNSNEYTTFPTKTGGKGVHIHHN